ANVLLNVLSRAELFIDVGAHYGFYTLLAARNHPQLRILAFEPVPQTFEVLRRNVALQRSPNVTVRPVAISDTCGTASFCISSSSDNCSFYPHPNAPPVRRLDVPTTTLDRV